jgi:hypothetical protein
MQDASEDEPPLPPSLRLLRGLVLALTVVMIAGFLVLIAVFVTSLRATPPALPDTITLPDGTTATAFTQGPTWFAVVTTDGTILIFDRTTGALFQTVTITRP